MNCVVPMPLVSIRKVQLRKQLSALRPHIYRVAFAWCGDAHRADDLTQDTVAKALSKLHQLKDNKSLRPWVFSILYNGLKDQAKTKGHLPQEVPPQQNEFESSAEEVVANNERILQVRQAVAKLAEKQRAVVILIDIEGFSYAETASILQLPVGTVMSRLNRARQRLRELLTAKDLNDRHQTVSLKRIK